MKKEILFGLFLIFVLFIAGCQEYVGGNPTEFLYSWCQTHPGDRDCIEYCNKFPTDIICEPLEAGPVEDTLPHPYEDRTYLPEKEIEILIDSFRLRGLELPEIVVEATRDKMYLLPEIEVTAQTDPPKNTFAGEPLFEEGSDQITITLSGTKQDILKKDIEWFIENSETITIADVLYYNPIRYVFVTSSGDEYDHLEGTNTLKLISRKSNYGKSYISKMDTIKKGFSELSFISGDPKIARDDELITSISILAPKIEDIYNNKIDYIYETKVEKIVPFNALITTRTMFITDEELPSATFNYITIMKDNKKLEFFVESIPPKTTSSSYLNLALKSVS